MASLRLPNELKNLPFSIKTAQSYGVSRFRIYRLVRKGQIEKIERGVYRIPAIDIDEENSFQAATLIVGSASAICLLSALSFYNLTDEIPHQIWVMVEKQKRVMHQYIRLIRTSNPNWNVGVEKREGFNITSIERTLIECVIGRRYLGKMIGIEAIKRALKENKTSLNKIISTASKLGKLKNIQSILEILV